MQSLPEKSQQINNGGLTAFPAPIRARLAAEGVTSLAAWRALGGRRRRIFGIVARRVRELDAAARRERGGGC
jgi:hypothetical protein